MKQLFSLLSICVLLVFSCDEDVTRNENICQEDLPCTEELRFLTYSPKVNGEAVILDDYYVKNLDNGNYYQSSSLIAYMDEGTYLIISDVRRQELRQSGTTLRFFGIKNGQIILQTDFEVGHDCCHIVPLSGPFDEFN